ncbi:hypothetical protein ACFYKT_18935 [Cytobacillus sp. FJAT-53684]|uniref:Uncharacterized protein n=1 Tax=Cytobacillus mangrovibacter TaxID=3299024 RepID=A0ABW6K604_9BACI
MNQERRIEILEAEVSELKGKVNELTNFLIKEEKKENREWNRNIVSDYMIKLVYPGIYCNIDKPKAGFPKNRRTVAEQLSIGQFMFIYVTAPEKKIIGLTKVVSNLKVTEGRWPYSVDLDWIIHPKLGVSFKDLDLDIRPRPGDTVFGLTDEKAKEIVTALKGQEDLDGSTLIYLKQKYEDTE